MEANTILSAPDAQARNHAKTMAGWMKFMGIVNIIGGAANALTIIGILWAWLPIWVGVVLNQAGTRAREYAAKGDTAALTAFTERLKFYFTLSGIVMIVSLVLGVIGGIVWVALFAAGMLSSSSLMEYFNR